MLTSTVSHLLHLFYSNRFEIYDLQFKSDGVTRRLSIEGPHPGNWFGVVFQSWTDPNNDRIEQQGNNQLKHLTLNYNKKKFFNLKVWLLHVKHFFYPRCL